MSEVKRPNRCHMDDRSWDMGCGWSICHEAHTEWLKAIIPEIAEEVSCAFCDTRKIENILRKRLLGEDTP
jgi:hypothetical protein